MNTSSLIPYALRDIVDEEIAAYRRDGAVVLRQVLPREWVERVTDALERIKADPPPLAQRTEFEGSQALTVQMAASVSEELNRFVFDSPAAEIAARVHGAERLHYFLDQIFYKEAGKVGETDWHQDTPYLNVEGRDLVRIWVPCDPIPRQLAIEVVRGSHLWNITYRPNIPGYAKKPAEIDGGFGYGSIKIDTTLPEVPDIKGLRDSFDVIGWAVEPGDMVVFHGHILHGARCLDNHPRPRRAFAVLYAGEKEQYLDRGTGAVPDSASIAGIHPATGDRLCDHPAGYPVAWPMPQTKTEEHS